MQDSLIYSVSALTVCCLFQYKWFFYMTEMDEDVPEDENSGDNISPQLLPNVEHLGIVTFCCHMDISIFCG